MKAPIALSAFDDNYIWVIPNRDQGTFMCVDPGEFAPVELYARDNGLDLHSILLTHHHHDHIGGVDELLNLFPNALVFGPDDRRITSLTNPLYSNDLVAVNECVFQVLDTPGHTNSHICYYEPNLHWLFCGDTLFSAGCGRVFDGSIEQLQHSLQILKHLPDETQVYCGHEYTRKNLQFALTIEPQNARITNYLHALEASKINMTLPSTIALEKQINPFLRTDLPSLKKYAENHHLEPLDELMIFKYLRGKKDLFY